MKIAIIGAGNVGAALGQAWASRGHSIFFGVPNPEHQKYESLRAQSNMTLASNEAAVAEAELVALATPWYATELAVRACGDLRGKVVMDCTNPLKNDFSGLDIGYSVSGAELVARWAESADVVKAMNQIGYSLMDTPVLAGGNPSMFLCGDSDTAKAKVKVLVTSLGFEAVDAGDLSIARLLEPLAMLWIHLAINQGLGTEFGFGILRGNQQENR